MHILDTGTFREPVCVCVCVYVCVCVCVFGGSVELRTVTLSVCCDSRSLECRVLSLCGIVVLDPA